MVFDFEKDGLRHFLLKNQQLSMLLRIHNGRPELLHFGAPVAPGDACALAPRPGLGFGDCTLYAEGNGEGCQDVLPLAYSFEGCGDFRELPMLLHTTQGAYIRDWVFEQADIYSDGSGFALPIERYPMPAAHGEHETLVIRMVPSGGKNECPRLYLVFDLFRTAIVRRSVLYNGTGNELEVERLMSSMLDLKGDFELTTLDGGWIAENHCHTVPVSYSRAVNSSSTGFSSSRHNPGVLLSRPGASEDSGEVYALNLIWSGNHYTSAQKSLQNYTRVLQGILPEGLPARIATGGYLETPGAVMTWSESGFNGVSANMHDFVLESIVPAYWAGRARPIVYNSWEGCMFSFNEARLLSLARRAKKLGCELFVLDDGWFGARNSDTAGLGDYTVNKSKLPGGLEGLSEKIRSLGLEFGLWFEPEAVNPDSDLYRAHPDWAIHIDGMRDLYGRNELLLDLRRADVRDYIVENVGGIIDRASISYVKWDMNRNSPLTGNDATEYVLGLYEVLHRIFDPRPQVLLESCSSGGNRFDLGMLTVSPQIWTSDDTDPIERLDIQGGTFRLYPQSTCGAHISAAPHAQTLRDTPLSTRANAALFGAFGLELDLEALLPVEQDEIHQAIEFYKRYRTVLQFGRLRVESAEKDAVCWSVRGEDNGACIAGLFHRLVHAAPGSEWLRIAGLDTESEYRVASREQLLRVGAFGSLVKHIAPVRLNPNGAVLRTADRHYRMKDGAEGLECSGAALKAGVSLSQRFSGTGYMAEMRNQGDFGSNVYAIIRTAR